MKNMESSESRKGGGRSVIRGGGVWKRLRSRELKGKSGIGGRASKV